MKKTLPIAFAMVLVALMASAKPSSYGYAVKNPSSTFTLKFPTGDTADSDPIAVNGTCTARYSQAGGDDVSLYEVAKATDAASSGSLVASFTASTTTSTSFRPGTLYVKAKATDATTGGSVLVISCSASQVSSGSLVSQLPSVSSSGDSCTFAADFGCIF